MEDLTREQKDILKSMHHEVDIRQPVLTMEEANYFKDSDEVKELLSLEQSSDYVADLCWKLESKGYINCSRGDDLANDITLTDKTITYMENRVKNGAKKVIDVVSKLKPF